LLFSNSRHLFYLPLLSIPNFKLAVSPPSAARSAVNEVFRNISLLVLIFACLATITQARSQGGTGIIKQAQESKADPVTTVANIFNNLGQNVSVKGDTLRQAITKAELKLDEFSSTLLANADSISKSGNHVTITSTKDTPGKIQRIRD
jgi:hypothetical protein